jgi:mannose-6-phosphate isomerase class I
MFRDIIFFTSDEKELVWGKESWTISAHEHGDVKVREGSYAGMTLSELWKEYPEMFGLTGGSDENFPLLVKIITANEDLSIQVHPDDHYAARNENGSRGKTECWYILDCIEDASLILGHNAKDKAELKELIDNGRFTELIREIPIHSGDFIQINPGTIHAIKGGTRLLEIQQSSDITYRLYDYDRIIDGNPRHLHLGKAFDVIECPAPAIGSTSTLAKRCDMLGIPQELFSCDYYAILELSVAGHMIFTQDYPFLIICVIAGAGLIDGRKIREGDHFILPYGYGKIGLDGNMRLILAHI